MWQGPPHGLWLTKTVNFIHWSAFDHVDQVSGQFLPGKNKIFAQAVDPGAGEIQ
jgi:hypothetical protein